MKFSVKLVNSFECPFSDNDLTKPNIEHSSIEECSNLDFDQAYVKINEFLDAPDHIMTYDEIKKEFSHADESKLSSILTYYNGRHHLLNEILHYFKNHFSDEHFILRKNIPIELNVFSCYENDEVTRRTKQLNSYIEIKKLSTI